MSTIPTVSDRKRNFYQIHNRPINSVFRRIVEELLVEMHLLSVNVDFSYDPIYALGIVSSFDRLMAGYKPEKDKDSIFEALCRAIDGDPQRYRGDSERMAAIVRDRPLDETIALLSAPGNTDWGGELKDLLCHIAGRDNFKYSRPFGIGLFRLLEVSGGDTLQAEKTYKTAIEKASQALGLPQEKLTKDLELYRSNLEKMEQVRVAIEDAIAADRKQRERREQEKKEPSSAG